MRRRILIICLLLCLLVFTGCSKIISPEPLKKLSQEDSISNTKQNLTNNTGARPKVKTGSLKIGGIEREVELKLLDGSPFSFYTYIPVDMDVERVSLGDGDSFDIIANFGDIKREDAYMSIFFYPAGTDTRQAVKFANSIILNNKWQKIDRQNPDTVKVYPWSASEWHFTNRHKDQTYLGNLAVGQHKDRVFHVLIRYPEDMAGEFMPRVQRILDEFVWTDNNEKLNSTVR